MNPMITDKISAKYKCKSFIRQFINKNDFLKIPSGPQYTVHERYNT